MRLNQIDPEKASTADLRKAIETQALVDLEMVKNKKTAPDHLDHQDIFAWAIQNVFTDAQKRLIWFDHGDNARSFCERFGIRGDIEEHIRNKLIKRRAALKNMFGNDDGCDICLDH